MEAPLVSSQPPIAQLMGKGFGVRAGAYVIDVVVMWITTLAVSFVTGTILGIILIMIGREISFEQQQFRALDLLIGFITSTLYFVFFEWLYSATPGKLILGLRVIMENGAPCSFRAAFIRALLRLIDGFFFGLPAYATMKEPLFQRIGDKSAKTVVIGAGDAFIQQAPEWWWLMVAAGIYLGMEIIASFIQTVSLLR
jgi:uncharacterized RDD family membrane protein YckC